ncbi:MAG: MotE family protein [Synergistaceae bacterium]|jgi:flagellar motility protein MotE (MotC chaperone)|nr:MotE family protein [Synergistaceae bacterium]
MAEERQRDGRFENGEDDAASRPVALKKKKKRGKGGLLFFLLLLALGIGTGLHFSGVWDARPLLWGTVPKIPYAGQPLSRLLGVPEQYTLTVAERRAYELAEWQKRLDERERNLNARQIAVDTASSDIQAISGRLAQREAAAQRSDEQRQEATASDSERKLIDQVAKTYQDMSPRNAAQIVEQVSESLAVELLQKLPVDVRGSILGKMDPRKAARLTELMAGR